MSKRTKVRIASILCAGVLVLTGSLSASAAQSNTLERDRLMGEHMGQNYTSISIDRYGNTAVDYVTGNLFLKLETPMQQFDLYYNSQDTQADSIFGPGFASRFQQNVRVYQGSRGQTPTANDVMVYQMEDGKRSFLDPRLTEEGELYWGETFPYGDCLRLEANGYSIDREDTDFCQLYGPNGQLLQFAFRHLAYLETFDVQYNAIDPNLVTDIYGSLDGMELRDYHLKYRDFNGPRAANLTMPDESISYDFRYDPIGRLIGFSGNSHGLETFTFVYEGDSSRILMMIDSSGIVTEFKYGFINGMDKVSFVTVKDANGALLSQKQFFYEDGKTTITDLDGTVTVKTY